MGKVIHMLTATACLQIPEEKKYRIDVIQMSKHWHLVQFKMVMETRHQWRLAGMIWNLRKTCLVVKGQVEARKPHGFTLLAQSKTCTFRQLFLKTLFLIIRTGNMFLRLKNQEKIFF